MNSSVSSQNIQEYAPLRNPPQFHFDVNIVNWQKISLWVHVGLCGNGTIIGSCFFEANLNDEWYLLMIHEETVPHLQEHFEQQQYGAFRRLWWVQDGVSAL